MGQNKSKENAALVRSTHFTAKEINHLRHEFENIVGTGEAQTNEITEEQFKKTVKKYVPSVTPGDDAFLERLYAAFDADNNNAIDFRELVDGLSVFMKGTPDEKLALSFKLYDVDHDGYITQPELERVMTQLSLVFDDEDRSLEIRELVHRMFDDLDINGDGRLSLHEYKLSAMKEPLIVDFLEQFLAEHDLSTHPSPPSRPASIRSFRAGSPNRLSQRSSFRLSQVDLLETLHAHAQQGLDTALANAEALNGSPNSPREVRSRSNSSTGSPKAASPLDNPFGNRHRLSRVSHNSLHALMQP